MSKRDRKLKRKKETRAVRRTFLVYCEGEVSEPEYLGALCRIRNVRETVSLELGSSGGLSPLSLVKAAAVRAKRKNSEIDEIWCVFDVEWPDNHAGLAEAMDMARGNDIQVAISNPCFELWLLLHFDEQSSWVDNTGARRRLRTFDRNYDKHIRGQDYTSFREDAIARARMLEERHSEAGTIFPNNNPSSGMFKLLNAMEPK